MMARFALTILVLIVSILSFGCEEDVTSVLGRSRAYTLSGVLSPQLDTQWVRVYPIEERLEPETDAVLDARFTSVNRAPATS